MVNVSDIIEQMLGDIDDEDPLDLYPFKVRVGIPKYRPTRHKFFEWMRDLGAIPDMSEKSITSFWVKEVKKAVDWYGKNPKGFKV